MRVAWSPSTARRSMRLRPVALVAIAAWGLVVALGLAPSGACAATEPSCEQLASIDRIFVDSVAEALVERMQEPDWRAALGRTGSWDARFEAVASHDLETLLERLSGFDAVDEVAKLPAAVWMARAGDVLVVAGWHAEAARMFEAARRAGGWPEGRCGLRLGSVLYALELAETDTARRETGYLLARDAVNERVLERHLLPGKLLRIRLLDGSVAVECFVAGTGGPVRERRLLSPDRPLAATPVGPLDRLFGPAAALEPASNFLFDVQGRWTHRFDGSRPLRMDRPHTHEGLERRMRFERSRDSTQPWSLFLLGQAFEHQGRQHEADAVWDELLDASWAVPYYELALMAWLSEGYGQPELADRIYRRALEARRRLPIPVGAGTGLRIASAPFVGRPVGAGGEAAARWPHIGLERRHLWWTRARELTGVWELDDIRSALWIAHFERLGDYERRRREIESRAAIDAVPFVRTTRLAWRDHAAWPLAAWLATAVALAILGGLDAASWLVRRGLARDGAAMRGATREASTRGVSWLQGLAVFTLGGLAAFGLTTVAERHTGGSAGFVAGGHDTFLRVTTTPWSAEPVDAADLPPGLQPAWRLEAALALHEIGEAAAAQRAYLGVIESATGPDGASLAEIAQGHLDLLRRGEPPRFEQSPLYRQQLAGDLRSIADIPRFEQRCLLPLVAALTPARYGTRFGYAALNALALLAGFCLAASWHSAGSFVVPGLASWRRGRLIHAALLLWLTMLLLLQVAWLRRIWLQAEPVPGPTSWIALPALSPETILPLEPLVTGSPSGVVTREALQQALDQLLRDEFWTVLLAYPGGRLVYPLLALAALALCVGHVVELRRARVAPR